MKINKRLIAIFISTVFFGSQLAAPALALSAQKDETVYVNLDSYGDVQNTIVVNAFKVPESGKIYDYGDYQSVTNLSNTNQPQIENGLIIWQAEPGSTFYYQGVMTNVDLPWTFEISYSLDGKSIAPENLIGADGDLLISIKAMVNSEADAYFKENYLAQISVSLETEKCKNIIAPDGAVVTAGSQKTATFTVMPGDSATFTISTDVTNFEMDGISISMVNMAGGMFENLDSLKVGLSQLTDGISELVDGTGQLKEGVASLASGIGLVNDGAKSISLTSPLIISGMDDLIYGAASLNDGLTRLTDSSGQIREGLSDIDTNAYEFEKGYGQIEAGLKEITDQKSAIESGLEELEETDISGMDDLSSGASQVASGIGSLQSSYDDQMALVGQLIATVQATEGYENDTELQQLVGGIQQYQTGITAGFSDLKSGASAVSSGIDSASEGMDDLYDAALGFGEGSLDLIDAVDQLHGGLTELNDGFSEYAEGISDLAINYASFDSGLNDIKSGSDTLGNGMSELRFGIDSILTSIDQLSDSIGVLADGAAQLPESVEQLASGQKQLLSGINGAGDDMGGLLNIDSDATPVSFAAPGMVTPNSVQFMIKTPDLHLPDQDTVEETQVELTFWQKLINLFTS